MKTLRNITIVITIITLLLTIWSPVYKEELVASSCLFVFLSGILSVIVVNNEQKKL